MITYPMPQFEQQRNEIQQRYKILSGTDSIDSCSITQTISLVFDVPIVVVALSERYRKWFRASHGVSESVHASLQDFCAIASLSEASFMVEDINQEEYFSTHPALPKSTDISFFAGAPLDNPNGQRFGTLCLIDHKPRQLSAMQMHILDSFSKMISSDICLRSAGRYAVRDLIEAEEDKSSLYGLAMSDPLTGALNRRAMMHFTDREVKRSNRHGLELSVIMMDIDFFKKVNDVHGHASGDAVLKAVSQSIQQTIRDEDILSRIGGEEFALILPETRPQDAVRLADRLRENLKKLKFDGDGGQFNITISMGISEPKQGDANIKPALERADKALYEAKHGGRDQVVLHKPELAVVAAA